MFLSSPIWLVALAPWIAVAAWMLWGRRRRVDVPFVRLWRGPIDGPRAKRNVQAPPLAIGLALCAALLAVLGASAPALRALRSRQGPALTVVLDRGLGMSSQGTRDLRYREAAEAARAELDRRFSNSAFEVVSVPGETVRGTDLRGLSALVKTLQPTAIDTRQGVRSIVAERLATTLTPIIVISDTPIPIESERVIQVVPSTLVHDTGIVFLAARDHPKPQVMVRVRNESSQKQCAIVVSSGSATIERQLDLPEPHADRDYFIDLPRFDAVISAELKLRDDVSADKQAWLVREGSPARIEARGPLPPALRRMIEVYQRARPPSDGSAHLAIVQDISQAPAATPAVIVPPLTNSSIPAPDRIAHHPITEHVRWNELSGTVQLAGDPPPGWTTVVAAGGKVLVAVSPHLPNQVWVGFDSPEWAETADYVIFWTNIFDWTGGGDASFAAHGLEQWTPEWKSTVPIDAPPGLWPGLYRRSDGAMRAFNAPAIPPGPPIHSDWRAKLANLRRVPAGMELSAPLLIAAIACLVLSAASWQAK